MLFSNPLKIFFKNAPKKVISKTSLTKISKVEKDIFQSGFGHKCNKRLWSFAPCYSQCRLWADFKEDLALLRFHKSLQKHPRNKKTRVYS
jgi:hypothetical protein